MERALAAARVKLSGPDLTFTELDASGSLRRITARPERWGDAVIVRKDVPASYHLAVVVDDARQGVSMVTRGQDLFPATDLHRLLQVLLDLPEPRYSHHPLMKDGRGRKFAKSARDTPLKSLREQGLTSARVRELVGLG
jgi:glutamyl-Q tRNA(Asp) synthetase